MKYIHKSLKTESKYRGWITGSFYPSSTVNYDKHVEVKVDFFEESKSFKTHYHKKRKSWTIVIKGAMHMVIEGKPLDIKAGEYILFEPGVTEKLVRTDPGTITVSIHTPSFKKSDKVEL